VQSQKNKPGLPNRTAEFWSFPDTDFPRHGSAQVSPSVRSSLAGAFLYRNVDQRIRVSKYFMRIIFFF